MKHGQTSIIAFLSKLLMTLSGFVATIFLTRTLGQDAYGTYVIVLSVLSWAAVAGNLGVRDAVRKRVSETTDGNYIISGFIVQFSLYALVALCLWIARPYLNNYMGIDGTGILILLLAVHLPKRLIQGILDGQHLVHVSSVLTPIEWTGRSAVQVALVVSGFGLTGAFIGYFAGAVVAAVIGLYFISVDWSLPSRRDFVHLKSFAQFSWLATVKGRTFLSMDTLVLALFVSNSLVAVYEITWNLASLFSLFGSSITKALFPEMSKTSSAENTNDGVSNLLRTGLAYMGLFIIPGLVGSAIIGDVVLTIYGPGFEKGYYVLLILTFARLLYGYMGQFTTTLGAINRPDLTFRVNIIFVAANLVLNLILTPPFGWYGAATATTTSTTAGLLMGYYYTNQHVTVTIPVVPISKQLFAAVVMAIGVYLCRLLLGDSLSLAIIFAGVGAGIYFSTLIMISKEFRTTVIENFPLNTLPLLSG